MSNASDVFRRLHAPGQLLVLPNAWDAATARLVEDCGAAAIATTSAGVAWALGHPDGNALPPDVLPGAVAAIARVIRVPLSVDVEAGYADDPARVASLVGALREAGAAGINIEDGAGTPDLLCAKIATVKRVVGDDVFVNARTDVYLRGLVPPERAVGETIERGRRYLGAGADGLFVPYVKTAADMRAIADELAPVPLNVMAIPGLADGAGLRSAGVRRLSAGSALASAALGAVRRLATAFLADGRSDPLFVEPVAYGAMNALLTR
jgi:2-methylisocitrate lyase-like PEP mutase family enzyme